MPQVDRPSGANVQWRALVALLLIVPAPSIGALMWFWLARGTTTGAIAYAIGKAWLYGLPIVWLLLVERGRLSWSPPRHGGLGIGALLGLLIAAVVFATWFLFAEARIDAEPLRTVMVDNGLDQPARYLLACAYLACVNALLEEYAFRWFISRQCENLMPLLAAILMSAAIFTVHHVIVLRAYFDWPMTALASAGVFIGGATWSWCFLRFRSIWPGCVSHAIVDIAIFVIGWRILFA